MINLSNSASSEKTLEAPVGNDAGDCAWLGAVEGTNAGARSDPDTPAICGGDCTDAAPSAELEGVSVAACDIEACAPNVTDVVAVVKCCLAFLEGDPSWAIFCRGLIVLL